MSPLTRISNLEKMGMSQEEAGETGSGRQYWELAGSENILHSLTGATLSRKNNSGLGVSVGQQLLNPEVVYWVILLRDANKG